MRGWELIATLIPSTQSLTKQLYDCMNHSSNLAKVIPADTRIHAARYTICGAKKPSTPDLRRPLKKQKIELQKVCA